MNAWVALVLAILSEVTATLSLKAAGGGSTPATVVVVAGYLISFALLSVVLRDIEIGTAYAVWAGAGTALIAAVGMAALGEAVTWVRLASLALVVLGVAGLNLSGAH